MKKFTTLITTLFLLCSVSYSLAALEPPVVSTSKDGLDITIDWTSVSGATGYTLYYAPVTDTGYGTISSKDMGASTTFNYTLWEGAAFYVAVKAYNDQESSSYSNVEIINIEPVSVLPEIPELSATTKDLNLSLSWNEIPEATGYILSYAPTSSYTGPESFITKDVGAQTSFSTTLWDGAAFTVAVQAYNEQGNSEYSNLELFTIQETDSDPVYKETACGGTIDDSTQNVDGSANRIYSHLNGDPVYGSVGTRRKTDNSIVYMRYLIHEPVEEPKALLVLIAGSYLTAYLDGDRNTGVATNSGANFLVRSAHLFAEQGYRVITINRPTDYADWGGDTTGTPYVFDSYRTSINHAVDLSRIINEAKNGDNLPVVIAGTSRGTISTVNQNFLADAIALSSPVTAGNGVPVGSAGILPQNIKSPTHVMWHRMDRCWVTSPSNSELLLYDFPNVTGDEIDGGFYDSVKDDPCNAYDYHSFLGVESCAVGRITSWLDSLTFDATRPDTKTEFSTQNAPLNPGETIQIDLNTVVTPNAGGELTYSLPYSTTSLGGTVSINGSIVTYTAAAGVSGTRDTFVYVVQEEGGGKANNRVVIQIK